MKTYCTEEMVGYPEIIEWVPADVARELFEVAKAAMDFIESHVADPDITADMCRKHEALKNTLPRTVLAKACNQ